MSEQQHDPYLEEEERASRTVIVLGSCTVFWIADLGLTKEQLELFRHDDRAATVFLDEMEVWCGENCKENTYRFYDKGVWFAYGNDALFFKLRWHQG